MKILLLTNKEHHSFIHKFYREYQSPNLNFWIFIDKVEEFPQNYDIGISFMYQHKVPAKEVNTHTWINFHPAPLPEYKGRNLCYHAIMNGEEKFGATIHYMDESFDTGNIISVVKFDIDSSWTAEDLFRTAMEESKRLFERAFPRILAGEVFPSFPNVGGKYYEKEPIHPYVIVDELTEKQIRAIYYPPHFPKIRIGNTDYRIVEEE